MSDYRAFLASKSQLGGCHGFEPLWLPDFLFPFQRRLVEWAVRQGRTGAPAEEGGRPVTLTACVVCPRCLALLPEREDGLYRCPACAARWRSRCACGRPLPPPRAPARHHCPCGAVYPGWSAGGEGFSAAPGTRGLAGGEGI